MTSAAEGVGPRIELSKGENARSMEKKLEETNEFLSKADARYAHYLLVAV